MADDKMKTRPEEYKEEYCEFVEEHMGKGLSLEAVAGQLGFSKKTLYNWAKRHPEFQEAIDKGREKGRLFWESLGIQGAAGNRRGFNATSWIFNMKNRYNWTDRQDVTSGDEKVEGVIIYKPEKDK